MKQSRTSSSRGISESRDGSGWMFPIASHDPIVCVDGWSGMQCGSLVGSYVPRELFSYPSRTEFSTTFFNLMNLSSKRGRTSTLPPSVDDSLG